MDLASGKLLPGDVDEIEVGNRLVDRYHSLWSALTDTDKFNPDEMWKIEQRVNKLNELGFDVDELEMKTAEDGKRVLVRPRVVDAGYADRKLLRLTGLEDRRTRPVVCSTTLTPTVPPRGVRARIWKSWPPTGCVRCSSRPCV